MTQFSKRKRVWTDVDPSLATDLTDARLQLHHAAQLVASMGISYLPKADDDSHASMEWFAGTLASGVIGPRPFRVGVRPNPLALVVIAGDAELAALALHGMTVGEGAAWLRGQIAALGLDASRFTLKKHYTIPMHAVARGLPFDASDSTAFEQLRRWYSDADVALRSLAESRTDASPVRCWPHHFDIATLLTVAPGKTIGVGLEPGDVYYDQPYWYVNNIGAMNAPLDDGGSWHTRDWTGAVLPGSLLDGDQRAQVMSFINSALVAG